MEIALTAILFFRYISVCIALYMISYWLLEDFLSKRMKEVSFLRLMRISRRLTAVVFLYGSAMAIVKISGIVILLLTSNVPGMTYITSTLLYSFVLIITIRYWKPIWYSLVKNKQTVYVDWYLQKYLSVKNNKDDSERAYEYLQKASTLKTDSVFIWSMMALFNECYFKKSDLADEYLAKARQVLDTTAKPSSKDKAVLEAVTGDIMLCRDSIDAGLAHLKTASEIDAASFKEKYHNALRWASEENASSLFDPK